MKIGVVGVGAWGKKVIEEYIQLASEHKIEKVYVFDSDSSRLDAYKNRDFVATCDSFDALMGSVDGMHLCVPNVLHYKLAKTAMEHGKHVLVEKPLTTSIGDARGLLKIMKKNKVVLEVGHIFRFANALKKTAELYRSGYFGKVYYINFYWTHLMPGVPGVDVMWDLLPHPLDMYNIITGLWPDSFAGTADPLRREKLSEVTFIEAHSKKGPSSTYQTSWLSSIRRRDIEIIGEKCSASIKAVDQTISIFQPDGTQADIDVVKNNTIRDEALNFIDSISTGESKINTADLGVKTVELILQIEGAFRHYSFYLLKKMLKRSLDL